MAVKPRHYADFDRYASACVRAAIADFPVVTNYDSHSAAAAKRHAIYAASVNAEEAAREAWEAHVEHMEDLYERGVGPAWEG